MVAMPFGRSRHGGCTACRAMPYRFSLHRVLMIACLSACGGSSPAQPDVATQPDSATGPTPSAACASVGTSYCQKMYACYSASDIASFQLPATETECVTMMNGHCTDAAPAPGYCKGSPQASASAATACSAALSAFTCTQLMQPMSSGACKHGLCAP